VVWLLLLFEVFVRQKKLDATVQIRTVDKCDPVIVIYSLYHNFSFSHFIHIQRHLNNLDVAVDT
jgi:hypothetical protein